MERFALGPLFVGITAWASALAARAETTEFAGTGYVQYHAVHKFHSVTGRSDKLEMRATLDEQGLKATARVPAASFDSGNSNRDTHVREIIGAERFPWIIVDVTEPGVRMPAVPSTQLLHAQASVQVHGVTVSHPIDVVVDFSDTNHALVTFEFRESLTAHQIERPSLLMVRTDDLIAVQGQARLERTAPPGPGNSRLLR